MEWEEVRKGGGLFLGVALVLFIFAAYSFASFLTGAMPKPTGAGSDFQNVLRGILLFVFTVGLLALGGWLSYKLLPGRAPEVIGFTITIFLVLYGIRSMVGELQPRRCAQRDDGIYPVRPRHYYCVRLTAQALAR